MVSVNSISTKYSAAYPLKQVPFAAGEKISAPEKQEVAPKKKLTGQQKAIKHLKNLGKVVASFGAVVLAVSAGMGAKYLLNFRKITKNLPKETINEFRSAIKKYSLESKIKLTNELIKNNRNLESGKISRLVDKIAKDNITTSNNVTSSDILESLLDILIIF